MDIAHRILSGTPTFVWFILAGLLMLGVRRLSPRRTHIAVAAAAPIDFTAWRLATIACFRSGACRSVARRSVRNHRSNADLPYGRSHLG